MGFCYSAYGLCCDFCSADHTTRKYVRKLACPYGYCQSWACCDQCRALKKHMASSCTPENKTHKEFCKKASQEHDKKEQQKQNILNEGYFIRCAALSHGVDKVKVIFRNKDDLEKAAFMTHAAYDKIPLGITAKLEDYEISFMAKNTDIYDSEGMEVKV